MTSSHMRPRIIPVKQALNVESKVDWLSAAARCFKSLFSDNYLSSQSKSTRIPRIKKKIRYAHITRTLASLLSPADTRLHRYKHELFIPIMSPQIEVIGPVRIQRIRLRPLSLPCPG